MNSLQKPENLENNDNFFSNNYQIEIYSLSWDNEDSENWENKYVFELRSTSVVTIFKHLKETVEDSKTKVINLLKEAPCVKIGEDKKEAFDKFLKYLEWRVLEAKKEKQTLILWFSSMWWQEFYSDLFEAIKKFKNIYEDIIFVIWWADFNAIGDKKYLEMIFEWWIDIINIWWAKEFIDFLAKLNDNDKFYRDDRWELQIETDKQIANNLLFAWKKIDIGNTKPWEQLEIKSYYDIWDTNFHFTIKNSWCLNSCHYCSNYIHEWTNNLKECDIEDSILDFNNDIKKIEDNWYTVSLDNPNPMQYIDRFFQFIKWINL